MVGLCEQGSLRLSQQRSLPAAFSSRAARPTQRANRPKATTETRERTQPKTPAPKAIRRPRNKTRDARATPAAPRPIKTASALAKGLRASIRQIRTGTHAWVVHRWTNAKSQPSRHSVQPTAARNSPARMSHQATRCAPPPRPTSNAQPPTEGFSFRPRKGVPLPPVKGLTPISAAPIDLFVGK